MLTIEIKELRKSYRNVEALKGISLHIEKGMFGLLGPNGAGKTTLMQILATLQPPTSGKVTVGDAVLGKDDQQIRKWLGYLPQEFGLYKKLTGYEYLDYIAMMKGISRSKERKEQINVLLEKVNLKKQANRRIASYSGGMKQRMGIAQALLGSPKLIIIDEPTVGLDPEERIRFRNLLSELSADRIVLLSTHIVSDIESSCNQLAIMNQGEIVSNTTPQALLEQVKDKVWSGTVSDEQLPMLKQEVKVISTRKALDGHTVRIVSDQSPFHGAERVSAGLEDAYISVMDAAKSAQQHLGGGMP